MSAIEFGLRQIKNAIPKDIIQIAFYNNSLNDMMGTIISVDENIRQEVIRDVVLKDISVANGTMHDVPLSTCKLEDSGLLRGYVYSIPKSETHGRNVLSIANISFLSGYSGYGGVSGASGGNQMMTLANAAIRSESSGPSYSTSMFHYMGNNRVFLPTEVGAFPYNAHFRCYLEYDEHLTGISKSTYTVFGRLCVLAAKNYIYQNMRVKIDRAFIEGGAEIGEIKDIISEYSDAYEMYQEAIQNDWGVPALLGDAPQRARFSKFHATRSS